LKTFRDLEVPPALHRALDKMGLEVPTPIQAQSIPVVFTGRDLIACAQTGTGKTAAFSIPMIVHLLKNPLANALVLAPTRELATQVHDVLRELNEGLPEMRSALLIGGTSMMPQLRSLKKRPRIIIATPGRLIDHLRQRSASLAHSHFLVLDEADRMLDMGFAPQLNEILKFLPEKRQTLLFSATLPPDIQQLARRYLKDPERVSVTPVSSAVSAIEQQTRMVEANAKNPALLDEITRREGTVIVFARTQVRTDRVARYLENQGVTVAKIHGGRSQGQRKRALEDFREGRVRVLVATDIAARGLDISHIAHVINYDLPQVAEDYVHRIGRTGRAGRSGEALSFLTVDDRQDWAAIQRVLTGKSPATNPTRTVNSARGSSHRHARSTSHGHPHSGSRSSHKSSADSGSSKFRGRGGKRRGPGSRPQKNRQA
jgi:superfamily II DNA/RNA helicase